jgi:ABC-type uncharacterized transport system permease subunit
VNYIWIILWLLVGLWSAALNKKRTLPGVLLFALLGPFGILVFALTPPRKTPSDQPTTSDDQNSKGRKE